VAIAGIAAVTSGGLSLAALYVVVFGAGVARGFAEPAISAWEAQIIPPAQMMKASAWFSSTWLCCAIAGPVLGGASLVTVGPAATFAIFAVLFGLAWISVTQMQTYPVTPPPVGESIWQSIAEGVKYVVRDQVLVGSMALDLFAVLFGGAIAILPVFASDILHVGPLALGFLNAAPNAGALVTMLYATRHPPLRHAGRTLLVAVVIRRSIVRLLSPKHLRGRIASVGMVFIGASNELGALESGLAAGWLGTVRSVWAGGLLTLLIVGVTAIRAPLLRRLRLDKPPLSGEQPTP
jgi:hypothetical protein